MTLAAPLALKHITVSRGKQTLLRDLSFTLAVGHITLLSGENGIGKTTLLQTIAGLCTLDEGDIDYGHIQHHQIRYIGHYHGLWPMLSIRENCCLFANLQGLANPQSIDHALAQFGLTEMADQLVSECSAGQKQRAALCQLIISPGQCWLLDEPLSALDSHNQHILWQLIEKHCQQQGIVCMTSHQALPQQWIPTQEIRLACNNACH